MDNQNSDGGVQTLQFNKNHKGVYSSYRLPGGRGQVCISNSLFPGKTPPVSIELAGLLTPSEAPVKPGSEEKAAAAAAKAQEKADKAAAKAAAAQAKAAERVAKAQAAAAAAVARAEKAAAAVAGAGAPATQPEL